MNTIIFEGKVTALSSISHIGETRGINSMLRREKMVMADGSVEEIPVISGNGMRGLLRDRGMYHLCRSLSYGVNEDTGEVAGLSLPAFYFLFSGGSLTKEGGKAWDIDAARKMRNINPLVSIFGGALGNMIMPGKIKIGKLIPLCEETRHLLPERFTNGHGSIWSMLQQEPYVRKDDEKDEGLRQLIAPEARALLEAKNTEKRLKREKKEDDIDTEIGKHQQMRYYVETFAAGTEFFWDICLDDVTEIEKEAFMTCLVEFARKPYIGGKSGIGHGKVNVKFDNWISIDPRIAPTGNAIDMPLGTKYAEHLQKNAEAIRDELAKIV